MSYFGHDGNDKAAAQDLVESWADSHVHSFGEPDSQCSCGAILGRFTPSKPMQVVGTEGRRFMFERTPKRGLFSSVLPYRF